MLDIEFFLDSFSPFSSLNIPLHCLLTTTVLEEKSALNFIACDVWLMVLY